MSASTKQQPTLEEDLREDPTIGSAPSPSAAQVRAKLEQYNRFSVGDMVVESLVKDKERFGIILDMYRDHTFSVRFVDGVDYTHASFCQLYSEWLLEIRKKI
tara:strand:- start:1169 stop:1474 length:306 start_codon:yes stop_codon:yes gene_type:complete